MNPFKFAGSSKTSHTHFRKLAIQARLMEGAGISSYLFALEPKCYKGHEIQHHPPSETCDKQRFRTRKAWNFMVTWLFTLSCTGPVGRHTTVHPSAGCVGAVRLTSQASGLLKSLSTDTPPRYDSKQQWKVVLQESSDRWRGLTCLKPTFNKISF